MSAFSASHQQPDKLMGILKSAKVNLRSVKNAFPIYKKHFWVLNFSAGRLEFYKNDQAPQAKGHVLGSQIRGVSFSGDRQNKFFDLCVQLRGGQERRFRMSSREERERWYKGIKSLAATFSTMNLFQSLVLAVHRRATQASNLSPFLIEVDLNALTEEHVQVTQYCLEAVDAGVEFARAIWRAMSNAAQLRAAAVLPDDSGDHSPSRVAAATAGAPEAPFQSVVLVVLVINTAQTSRALAGSMGSDETAGEDGSSDSTRYDPSTRQLTLTISVVKEADYNSETGEVVQIRHAEVDQAISMLQSDVWRNPFIEGWLTGDLRSNDTRREMAQYLGLTTEFVVTMQWGDNMDDVDRIQIEQYLERYVVSSTILDDVFLALREVASQQDPYEAQYGGGGSNGPARSNAALVAPFPTPREILRKYVVGVAVRLDRRTVQGDREPTLVLLHRMWNDRTMGGSIAVLSQWRSSQRQHRDDGPFTMLAQPISVNAHSAQAIRLMAQLNDVVLHARLSHAILTAEDTITHCLNCRDRCRADWEEYFRAMREDLGTPLPAGSLPWMVLRFLDVYIPRLQRAVTSLSQTPLTLLQQQKMLSPAVVPATPAPTAASRRGTTTRTFGGGGEPTEEFHHRDPSLLNGSNNVLDDVVLRCMSSLFIKFVSAGRRRQEDTASSHVPTLRNGILTDTVVLLNALRIRPDDIEREFDMAPISVLPASVVPLSVVYTVPVLSTWLRGYFVTPESLVVAPDRPHVPAMEDDDDSSGDDLEGGFGEAVASERKTETTILSVQNVVTILYDTQPNSERRLKIGVSVIRQAIEALDAAFPNEGRISKHNMLRILTINLSRLRELFATHVVSSVPELTHSSGDVTFDQEGTNLAVVPLPLAERLLRHYCEFEESERLVETLLERYYPAAMTTTTTAEPGRAGGAPSSQPASQVREDLVPAAAASWPAYHRHRHSRRSDDTTTIPYETIAAVALTQLLPLEAKLAWTCRRDVVVVGLEGAGKSTLARLLRQTEAVPPSAQPQLPTIGMSESVVAYKEWVFLVKELGGRLDFRSNWKQYLSRLQRADALVFVVDAQSPALLSEASEFLHQIAPFSLFRGCPLLIIYNRYSDTKDRMANPNSRSRFQQQQQQQQRSSTTTTHSKTQARVEAFNDRMRLQDVSGSHEICSCVCPVLEAAPSLPSTSSSATPLLTRTNSTGGNVIHRRTGSSGGGGEIRGVPSLDEGFDWVCEQLRKKSERDSLPAPLKK